MKVDCLVQLVYKEDGLQDYPAGEFNLLTDLPQGNILDTATLTRRIEVILAVPRKINSMLMSVSSLSQSIFRLLRAGEDDYQLHIHMQYAQHPGSD